MTAAPEPVYLVEGSDPALVAEAVSSLVSELVGDEERALAVEDYGGEEVDLASVADSCATPTNLSSGWLTCISIRRARAWWPGRKHGGG